MAGAKLKFNTTMGLLEEMRNLRSLICHELRISAFFSCKKYLVSWGWPPLSDAPNMKRQQLNLSHSPIELGRFENRLNGGAFIVSARRYFGFGD